MEIKVLGPGCPKPEATETNVEEAVTEPGLSANLKFTTMNYEEYHGNRRRKVRRSKRSGLF
jgi:hypothetical protein